MNTEVMIKILMSESSSDEETKIIQEELQTILHQQGIKPASITCRHGSTEVIIQFIVESMAKGALGAIGALFFNLIRNKLSANNQTSNTETLISQSQQDYIEMLEITPNDSGKELPEVVIDDDLCLMKLGVRSSDVKYTLAITETSKGDNVQVVTQYDIEITDGQVKKFAKSESQYFE
jgi:hypothetical protein